jgi:hypothetical protein
METVFFTICRYNSYDVRTSFVIAPWAMNGDQFVNNERQFNQMEITVFISCASVNRSELIVVRFHQRESLIFWWTVLIQIATMLLHAVTAQFWDVIKICDVFIVFSVAIFVSLVVAKAYWIITIYFIFVNSDRGFYCTKLNSEPDAAFSF